MSILRQTYAEINLKNIKHNLEILKKFAGKNVNILAVVKADAYGHGAVAVAKTLENTSVKVFGVATIEEGIELRRAGIKKDILILGSIYPFRNFEDIITYKLIPTIASVSGLKALNSYAKKFNKRISFHLKIDTGMGRIGITPNTSVTLLENINKFGKIYMEGIYSHIPCAVESKRFTQRQISSFKKLVNSSKYKQIKYKHISASASILKYKASHFNMVRPGLLIYGLLPFDKSDKVLPTKPALSLKTNIIFLKTVPKNTSISYCRTFFTKKRSKIATIAIGYADGFLRTNSSPPSDAKVLVKGKRVPVAGRVCMDMAMIDVTDVKNVSVGDEVVIIGSQNKENISAEEVAKRCGTINYEILTSISKRVPRVYV
ncbi:MAG: alanine racemase [Elusimicrobia bacterium]|nr:alanine racemase [Elusimicrobiota bacterium]